MTTYCCANCVAIFGLCFLPFCSSAVPPSDRIDPVVITFVESGYYLVECFDIRSGEQVQVLPGRNEDPIWSVEFAPRSVSLPHLSSDRFYCSAGLMDPW